MWTRPVAAARPAQWHRPGAASGLARAAAMRRRASIQAEPAAAIPAKCAAGLDVFQMPFAHAIMCARYMCGRARIMVTLTASGAIIALHQLGAGMHAAVATCNVVIASESATP